MRNIPFTLSLKEAHESVDFSKLVKYGEVWTPLSIEAGDVMRADLPTYYNFKNHGRGDLGLDAQQGYDSRLNGFFNFNQHAGLYDPDSKFQLMPRNTIVLGFDVDIETYDVRYVRLARFSYGVDSSSDPIIEPQFWPEQISHFAKPVVFKGRKIDFAYFDSGAIGRLCDKVGTITKPSAITKIRDALFASEEQRSYLPDDLEGTLFVPAIDPRKWKQGIDFSLIENDRPDYKGTDFSHLDEASQNEFIEDALWVMAERVSARRHQFFHERDLLFRAERTIQRKTRTAVRKAAVKRLGLDELDSETRRKVIGSVIDDLDKSDKALVDKFANLDEEDTPNLSLTSGKRASVQTLLGRAVEKYQAEAVEKKRLFEDACQGTLTQGLRDKFESVGIGGLKKEPNIEISGPLFRWRLLMMRVPDLNDPEQYSDVTYRPCVVWNGFWSLNEQGDPELAGLELYPITRHAENFSWKMGIENPLKTKSTRTSFIIPELLIRAPMSTEYFQPNQPPINNFMNLGKADRASFETKLNIFGEHVGAPNIWGLQERPQNWISIEDDGFFELPEESMRFARRQAQSTGKFRKDATVKSENLGIQP